MILVTGIAGFIGSNFALDWASASGEALVGIDKLTYAGNRHNLDALEGRAAYHFIQADIGDQQALTAALQTHRPRAVINFAAESHVDRSICGPEDFIQTNLVGTFRLLESVRAYWQALPAAEKEAFRFVHVSTDEVYGSLAAEDPAFSEKTPAAPNSPYAASKAGSDHLVRAWRETYGLPTLTTNCSNNYGPYQFPEKLIPLMIHNALGGAALPVYGDGLNVRDWLYVGDHAAALRLVLAKGRVGETYNIGGRSEKKNIDVVQTLCHLLDAERPRADGKSYAAQIQFVKDRPGHDRRYAIDARKIEAELGWRPTESFETGLLKTVRWYLANEAWTQSVTSGAYRNWIEKHYGSAPLTGDKNA